MSKKTLTIKQSKQKEALVEQIKKAPIIQLACERVGLSRATFYRWRKDDEKFAEAVEEALESGSAIINDLAESKLISAIKEQNLTAIIFWLKHHHRAYATRVELSLNKPQLEEKLSPEEQEVVKRALAAVPLPEIEGDSKSFHDSPSGKKRKGS